MKATLVDLADNQKSKFERELEAWLNENFSALRRVSVWFWSKYHNFPTIKLRWGALPNLFSHLALSASGPAIAYHTAGVLTAKTAGIAFAIVLLVVSICKLIDLWSQRKADRISTPLQTIWVRVGDLLNTVKSGATRKLDQDASIEASLAIATSIAAEVLHAKSDDLSASLVLYEGSGFSKMRLTHRDRGSKRPTGRLIHDIDLLLGHHACQHATHAPRVVGDLRRFGQLGKRSPTQPRANYRSIFFQPVVSSKSDKLMGFISIDCRTPYAFHGARADDLAALLEPIKAHIEDMI